MTPCLHFRKLALVALAFSEHGVLHLCSDKTLDQSFTFEGEKLLFWFNDKNKSTHVVTE